MNDADGVQRVDAPEHLPNEEAHMILVDLLVRANDLLQIHLHTLAHEVQIAPECEMVPPGGAQHLTQADDVRMWVRTKVLKDSELAQAATQLQGVRCGRDFFDGDRCAAAPIDGRADHAVATLAKACELLEVRVDDVGRIAFIVALLLLLLLLFRLLSSSFSFSFSSFPSFPSFSSSSSSASFPRFGSGCNCLIHNGTVETAHVFGGGGHRVDVVSGRRRTLRRAASRRICAAAHRA